MQNNTVYRHDYRPYPFTVTALHLAVDLFEDKALITSQMTLKRIHPGALRLNGEALELVSVHLNNQPLDAGAYRLIEGDLLIESCPDEVTLTIVTLIRPQENTALSGLYRSNRLFCTQCEAEGFRRITFFPDRPDVLTVYTTRISAVKADYPVLLSNGNCIDSGDTADGRHWVVWHDPFKKPSYLFALVAGDLRCVSDQFITQSNRTIDCRIYVEPGHENQCQHALISLKNAMRWDEEKYGREYDLDTFMIVAVSDFNMGAMENKGLNIFNSKYILASPNSATDQDYADIEGIVGHEYFHNWTGNRVTCQDWFQLSLKEGLTVFRDQEFSSDMNSREVNRILDVNLLRHTQFPEDAGTMAHPVRPESYQEINNFYTATIYNKGAEVIRMQHALLGEAGFRRGMDLYFERHDGQAVTIDDFVAAMEDANHVDFTQFKRWYSQAGTPEVSVKREFVNDRLTLTLTQSCPETPEGGVKEPFHIPIRMALFGSKGDVLNQSVLELKSTAATFHVDGLSEEPIVSLLRDFSAPIQLHFKQSSAELRALLQFESNGYAKWNAAQILALNTLTDWIITDPNTWIISPQLIDAYRHVLENPLLDQALRADLLTPPAYEDLAATLTAVDVTLVEQARAAFSAQLGSVLFSNAEQVYKALTQKEDHQMNGAAYARRKLKNKCLSLMMKGNEIAAIQYCQTQFATAKTMTDKSASFALLVNSSSQTARQQAIDAFYNEWSSDDLVLDKWFAVQARSDVPGALLRVKALLTHKAFHMTNPNKVRAVIGAFIQGNPLHFHAIDGSGYAFLTEMLLQCDAINPQVAARLATPFTRWKHLNAPRQALIAAQLKQLADSSLSRDLREIVEKSRSLAH